MPSEEKGVDPWFVSLEQAGIKSVLIIDDMFDDPTTRHLAYELVTFCEALEDDDELLNSTRERLGRTVEESSEITDDDVRVLLAWHRDDPVNIHLASLFKTYTQERSILASLKENLMEFGLEVECIGPSSEIPDGPQRLVFLDYSLDPSLQHTDPSSASAMANGQDSLSQDYAQKLYELSKLKGEPRPFIVLMSGILSDDDTEMIERWRRELLGGLFGYIPKNEVSRLQRLRFRLATWGLGNHAHQVTQNFVEAVSDSLHKVVEDFEERIRGFDVQDYVNLQVLTLEGDGHPLGDYMLWLFESVLGYTLRDNPNIKKAQNALDRVEFDRFLGYQNGPSRRLAEAHRCAMTEPPVEPNKVPSHPKSQTPYLTTGDIFVNQTTKAPFLVVSNGCDLAYSPGKKRKYDFRQQVLMMPGQLVEVSGHPPNSKLVSELFEYRGVSYRVVWQPSGVFSRTYGNLNRYTKSKGFVYWTRLRLAYALQIQEGFIASLAQPGMPA